MLSTGATGAESMMHRLLDLKGSLPAMRREIFDLLYQQGMTPQTCAAHLGLSPEQFEIEHTQMLCSLRIGTSGASGTSGTSGA